MELCEDTCLEPESNASPTLGTVAASRARVRIAGTTRTTLGTRTDFADLAHLHCDPQAVVIDGKTPYVRHGATNARCARYTGEHDAKTLTGRETVVVVLSHGPGWQGRQDPYAWYARIAATGTRAFETLEETLGDDLEIAIYGSPPKKETKPPIELLARGRLDGDAAQYRQMLRGIHHALKGWPVRARTSAEIGHALAGVRDEMRGAGGVRAMTVLTGDPGDGVSCNPAELEALGSAVVVGWTQVGGEVSCAPVAEWDHSPLIWIENLGVALAERAHELRATAAQ